MVDNTTDFNPTYSNDAASVNDARNVSTAAGFVSGFLNVLNKIVLLAAGVCTSVAQSLGIVLAVFPPLRLAIEAIISMWTLLHAIFIDEGSKVERAEKAVAAVVAVSLFALAIFVPALGIAALFTGMGFALIRQAKAVVKEDYLYLKARKLIKYKERQLAEAMHRHADDEVKQLKTEITSLNYKYGDKHLRSAIYENITLAFSTMSLVGAVCLVIPGLQIVGISILLATAVGGLVLQATKLAVEHAKKKQAPTFIKDTSLSSKEHKSSEDATVDIDGPAARAELEYQQCPEANWVLLNTPVAEAPTLETMVEEAPTVAATTPVKAPQAIPSNTQDVDVQFTHFTPRPMLSAK